MNKIVFSRSIIVLLVCIFVFSPGLSLSSSMESLNHVSDQANVLNIQEEAALEVQASEVFKLTGFDIILHTTNDSMNKGPMNYSFDYYHSFRDAENYPNGAMLVIMFDTRDYYEAARGQGIELLTHRESTDLGEIVQEKISSGNYFGAMEDYINYIKELIDYPNDLVTSKLKSEIRFRNIPWGTSFAEVKKILRRDGIDLYAQSGDNLIQYTIDTVIYHKYTNNYEPNVSIWTSNWGDMPTVAGYQVENVVCNFASLPVNGALTHLDEDSALFAAKYEIVIKDAELAFKDLEKKLNSIYGTSAYSKRISPDISIFVKTEHYIFWNGANDTRLVLKWEENEETSPWDDSIFIIYVWNEGDTLLKNANDVAVQMTKDAEEAIRESNIIDGL